MREKKRSTMRTSLSTMDAMPSSPDSMACKMGREMVVPMLLLSNEWIEALDLRQRYARHHAAVWSGGRDGRDGVSVMKSGGCTDASSSPVHRSVRRQWTQDPAGRPRLPALVLFFIIRSTTVTSKACAVLAADTRPTAAQQIDNQPPSTLSFACCVRRTEQAAGRLSEGAVRRSSTRQRAQFPPVLARASTPPPPPSDIVRGLP